MELMASDYVQHHEELEQAAYGSAIPPSERHTCPKLRRATGIVVVGASAAASKTRAGGAAVSIDRAAELKGRDAAAVRCCAGPATTGDSSGTASSSGAGVSGCLAQRASP